MTNKKKQIDWKIVCTGIVCLTGAELYALSQGINGVIFTIFVAIIAAAIGISVEKPKFMKT